MLKLSDSAKGPLEALAGVPQVAHDEAVLPAALARTGAAQVRRRRGTVVHGAQTETMTEGLLAFITCEGTSTCFTSSSS